MPTRVHHLYVAKFSLTMTLFPLLEDPNFNKEILTERLETGILKHQRQYVPDSRSLYEIINVQLAGEQDRRFVIGRLARSKPAKVKALDTDVHDMTTVEVKNAANAAMFLFEPWTEVVVFEERLPQISKNQFCEAFARLLEANCGLGPFRYELIASKVQFFQALDNASKVLEANFDLTPVNFGDRLEFKTLAAMMQEAKTTDVHIDLKNPTDGVNRAADLYREPLELVKRGQGKSRQRVLEGKTICVYDSEEKLATETPEIEESLETATPFYVSFLRRVYDYYPKYGEGGGR